MALSYKDGKVMDIILEFIKVEGQDSYDVSGIEQGKAVFFWRKEQQIFETIPGDDYTLIGGNTLRIDNPTLLEEAYEFQVCYENFKLSSEYVTELPEIGVLKEKYNEAVKDIHIVWDIFREIALKADTTKLSIVIPELADGETFAWNDTDKKFYSVQVADLQLEADQKKDQITAHANSEKARITTDLEEYVETVEKPELKAYGIAEVDNHVATVTKPDITAHATTEKTGMSTHANDLMGLMDDKFDELKQDNGVAPAGADIYTLAYGRWWTADVTGLINYPPEIKAGGGTIDIAISDDKKVIKYYAVDGSVWFCHETDTAGVFTDWFSMSGSDVNAIPVGQLGGTEYRFAPVMWDNSQVKYVLATTQYGADGIAVNCHTSEGFVIQNTRVKIPLGSVDSDGNAFEDGHWYFLAQDDSGRFQKTKPTTGVWQELIYVSVVDGDAYAIIEISTTEDITPLVITENGKTAVVERGEFKFTQYDTVVGLGLVDDGKTTFELIEAMPDMSELIMATATTENILSDLPSTGVNGQLIVRKHSRYRCSVEFTNSEPLHPRVFKGGYYDGVWYGWKHIPLNLRPDIGLCQQAYQNGTIMTNGYCNPNAPASNPEYEVVPMDYHRLTAIRTAGGLSITGRVTFDNEFAVKFMSNTDDSQYLGFNLRDHLDARLFEGIATHTFHGNCLTHAPTSGDSCYEAGECFGWDGHVFVKYGQRVDVRGINADGSPIYSDKDLESLYVTMHFQITYAYESNKI